jgi:energy-coupling factor transporter ATP-binding protein EcfA2
LFALEVETNNYLMSLGLPDHSIAFEMEKKNKSGTGTVKGFNVFVRDSRHSDPIPWNSWSGGEAQRLRVAGTLGLTSLLKNKLGVDCNTLFIDEPTAGLSEQGVDDLLNCLKERSDISTYLIDHRSLDWGFDSITEIVKTEKGSIVHDRTN